MFGFQRSNGFIYEGVHCSGRSVWLSSGLVYVTFGIFQLYRVYDNLVLERSTALLMSLDIFDVQFCITIIFVYCIFMTSTLRLAVGPQCQ